MILVSHVDKIFFVYKFIFCLGKEEWLKDDCTTVYYCSKGVLKNKTKPCGENAKCVIDKNEKKQKCECEEVQYNTLQYNTIY